MLKNEIIHSLMPSSQKRISDKVYKQHQKDNKDICPINDYMAF